MSTAVSVLVLQLISLAAICLTLYRLFQTGLYRKYPIFCLYLGYRVPVAACVLLINNTNSKTYFYFFVFSASFMWIFYLLAVRELYGLVLERHRGLYTVGRWAMYLGVVVSIVISLLYLLPRFRAATSHSKIIAYVYAIDRGVTLSMAIFIVLMLVLLSQYAALLSRNVVIHAIVSAAFFLSNTISTLLKSVFGIRVYAATDTALLAVSAACTLGWFFLLKPEQEGTRVQAPVLGPKHERRILSQLDHLNATLQGAGRK